MADEGEGPLARWSRLKRRSRNAGSGRRGGAAPVTVANVDPGFPAASAPGDGLPATAPGEDAPAGEDAALPPIDSLDKDSDYTPFLKEGVPEKLARVAMRKLWRSDPIFGFRDGLDDYDEDYSIMQTIAEAMTGKGRRGKATAKKAKGKAKTAKGKAKPAKAKAKKTKGKAGVQAARAKGTEAKRKKKSAAVKKTARTGGDETA